MTGHRLLAGFNRLFRNPYPVTGAGCLVSARTRDPVDRVGQRPAPFSDRIYAGYPSYSFVINRSSCRRRITAITIFRRMKIFINGAAGVRIGTPVTAAAAAAVTFGGDHLHNPFKRKEKRQPNDQSYYEIFHFIRPIQCPCISDWGTCSYSDLPSLGTVYCSLIDSHNEELTPNLYL